jgi:TolB-like protein/Tfp pilus assembly protein PilF
MAERVRDAPPSDTMSKDRLDSWKEIAAYLHRDVTTVQRWEKREGMPVHRHVHDRSGSVYAYPAELDTWLQSRKLPSEEEKGLEPESPADLEPDASPAKSPSATTWFLLAAVGLIALIGVTYIVGLSRPKDAVHPRIRSLAVIPLKNLSGDAAQEYLADGMTEAVIGRLSGIRDLRVVSRTSSMRFKDTQMSVPEIAKSLQVDAIVEGSVMRQGSRLRVHAQLIRAATDEHFWSEQYDRELSDALALESDVAQAIAKKVEVTISGDEHARLAASRAVSPEVYESYLKGRFTLANKDETKAGIEESIGYFEEGIKKDPTFALDYMGLADAHGQLSSVFIGAPPALEREKAASAARKALELDPSLLDARLLLADLQQQQWHWAAAEAEYKRALELNPNNSAAHGGSAQWLLCEGRTEEALSEIERARELDPLAVSGVSIGWILFHARRYDEAMRELRSVLAVRPNDSVALWFMGFVLIAAGQPTEAIPYLEKALMVSDRSPGVIGVLIRAYAHAGRRTDALRLLTELKRRKQAGYIPAAAFVNAYLGLGDNQEAFAWLEQGYKEQSNILQFLKVHPYFDPLRGDPRFKSLLQRVGLD